MTFAQQPELSIEKCKLHYLQIRDGWPLSIGAVSERVQDR